MGLFEIMYVAWLVTKNSMIGFRNILIYKVRKHYPAGFAETTTFRFFKAQVLELLFASKSLGVL